MATCMCASATCNCLLEAGPGSAVAGSGGNVDPFVVSVALVTADTATIDVSGDGGAVALSADLIVSPDGGNILVAHPNGAYVPALGVPSLHTAYATTALPALNGVAAVQISAIAPFINDGFVLAATSVTAPVTGIYQVTLQYKIPEVLLATSHRVATTTGWTPAFLAAAFQGDLSLLVETDNMMTFHAQMTAGTPCSFSAQQAGLLGVNMTSSLMIHRVR